MKAEDELKELEQNSVSYQGFSNGVEVYTFTHDELARYKKLVTESQLQALKEEVEKEIFSSGNDGHSETYIRGYSEACRNIINLITNLEDK